MPPHPKQHLPELTRRLRAGDTEALEELFNNYYGPLLRYVSGFTRSKAQAKDVVQDTFLRLWKRRKDLDENRSLRALLFTMVRNRALNQKRDAMNRKRLLEEHAQEEPERLGVDEKVAGKLLEEKIRGWIGELPERRREAFELSRFSGLTYEEIAEVMEVSPRTVENHIRLALQDLRGQIKKLQPELLTP